METSSNTKRKTIIKRVALSVAAVALILFSVLAVHIYNVTKPVKYDNNDLQLSRIDFKQPIDSLEAFRIRHFVSTLPGIENTVFNLKDGILIYGFKLGKQNSSAVFDQVIQFGHYKAEKFVPSNELLNSGCPMGKNRNSIIYKASAFIYDCFN